MLQIIKISSVFTAAFLILQIANNSGNNKKFVFKQDTSAIKVMSYNIRYDNPADGINAWSNRKDHLAEMIGTKYKADIIGIQEAMQHQIEDLQQRLSQYEWTGVGRDDGRNSGEFSPVFLGQIGSI